MAVAKPMTPSNIELMDPNDGGIEVDLETGETSPLETTVTETEDGGVIIDFGGGTNSEDAADHDANLAEFMDDSDLGSVSSDLVDGFLADQNSRKEWSMAYVKGLDLLGMKIEDRTQPWSGASGVYHPMLSEAVVRFQAQAMGELMPASGPARSKIVGKITPEKTRQAYRVEQEMNYQITEIMPDYRNEMEQMLFRLPLAGSAFKKLYFDPVEKRPVSIFVPAEDLVASYGASNLRTCPRFTHVMRKTANEIAKLQAVGFYRDVDLPDPEPDRDDIHEKYDEIDGQDPTYLTDDDRYLILEMHVDIDLPGDFASEDGIALPYVVTIDKSSKTILSIRRNWYADDEAKKKRMHVVHYPYLPGMGFYGTGLIHLIGGLAKSATSILRQLIDAGTLSNLPAGLKSRSLRIKGDNTPLMPGEWRDADVAGGTLRDSLFPMPYKEPSSVLYTLLGNVVDEGRRIGSVADIKISDMGGQAPVGTTLAILERSLKVMSGVQARLHAAMKDELRLLAGIIKEYMPPEYDYEVEGDFNRQEDFGGPVDIIPVSDPNAATMAQRIMQYQAALQLAQQAPQLYDLGKLHQQMLAVLGIKDADTLIKLPADMKPKDPVTENMAILKQEPIKAFLYQDHDAHITVHMAAMQDPKLQQMIGQSPFAQAIQSATLAHINEHLAMAYRKGIEKQLGVPLPAEEEQLPEDVEVQLSQVVAQAAQKLLEKSKVDMAQQQAQQDAQDPLTQIQQKELQIKEMQVQGKLQLEEKKLQVMAQNNQANIDLQRERILSENKRAGAQVGIQRENNQYKNELAAENNQANIELQRERLAAENKRAGAQVGVQRENNHHKHALEGAKLAMDTLRNTRDGK
ncbi:hypothetical protein UFOVP1064_70 [uncultured Caudovirales phage]|uniref:Uncharacterized protein n=1 Tax=uncultured Caudovirales phage TaxID=2100421 RepID=A0A6J5QLZ1_9CAUD|nr:hypothetical protein UFOVP659_5 [uncultured Caudovirales phage]CAB4169553.1 hypothetical protein UFOVP885_58 [uncultured Caudovirales phage]CAB4181855.1 hypothetical protein UFOVP1064_70 [uncultured Caudovirales phage]CAB4190498.1 hypothetical protein UFOVP1197_67 [uncultured Caudovirales phage]CAB4195555.1 hypothetical protein UFOVP1294_23 [uncultured Caudovirales phage]